MEKKTGAELWSSPKLVAGRLGGDSIFGDNRLRAGQGPPKGGTTNRRVGEEEENMRGGEEGTAIQAPPPPPANPRRVGCAILALHGRCGGEAYFGSLPRYLAGLASNFLMQGLQQNLIS